MPGLNRSEFNFQNQDKLLTLQAWAEPHPVHASVIIMKHVTVSQQLSTMLYVYVIVMECSINARFCSEESLPSWN